MANQQDKQPDVDELLRRIPPGAGDLFRGASAWGEDLPGFRRSVQEELQEGPGRKLRRTVWDEAASDTTRILIDVVECPSAADAVKALLDRLEWNQLASLPVGPSELGLASFMHPEGAPPALFFARANLCVSVASFARRAAAVLPVARALDRRLLKQPTPGGEASLSLEAERGAPGTATILRVAVPYRLAEEGHLRYRVRGGSLEIRDDQVVVVPEPGVETHVEVHAEEAGRRAATGSLLIRR